MPHSCGDFDVPVISVCGTEILMEKFDIQKLVVYATDLDKHFTSRTGFWPFRTRDGQIEDWNKKLNLLRFAAYGFVNVFMIVPRAPHAPQGAPGTTSTTGTTGITGCLWCLWCPVAPCGAKE